MSTFTNWNGPQGCGPTKDMWQELINQYKELLSSTDYVKAETGKGLSTEDFTTALKNKLEAINQSTASKDIGNVASGSTGLVTGDAVYQFCRNFVQGISGKGLSTNDFSNAYKSILDAVKECAYETKATSISTTQAGLVTAKLIATELGNYVKKDGSKGLSSNDFTDKYVSLLEILTEYSIIFKFKEFQAPVSGSNANGIYFILGMLDERAGTAYLRYTDTGTSFAAAVNFAVTATYNAEGEVDDYTNGQLSVTTDAVNGAGLEDVHFLIVKGSSNGKKHVYLAIQAKDWYSVKSDTYVSLYASKKFEGSGVNFYPVGAEGYIDPTDSSDILVDYAYYDLVTRMDALEHKWDGLDSLKDKGVIVGWQDMDNIPAGFAACDGQDGRPLIDYHIIQTRNTVDIA